MREKAAAEEAAARPCDHLFRVMFVPARLAADYSFVTKFYLTQQNGSHEASGWVTLKVRFGDAGFAERSRALTADEISLVWRTFDEEDIFSLSAEKWEPPAEYRLHLMDGSTVVFSHFDNRTRQTEEVTRGIPGSEPAAHAVADLGKPFDDLIKELEKLNPFEP